MTNQSKEFELWIPLILFLINIVLISYMLVDLMNILPPPNYGAFALLAPIIALGSLLYIREYKEKNTSYLIRILQGFNWFFIIFPVAFFSIFPLALI